MISNQTVYLCRHCDRRVDGHCDECRSCWHWGLDMSGHRELGCPLHDRLTMTLPWRFTTFEVAR